MRGFEIKFGNNTIRIAENEQVSIMIEKIYDQLNFHCGGFITDKNIHLSWYHGNLKLGDEIIIERKEFEESSEPIITSEVSGLTAEELAEKKLKDFRVLENQLKEKGLI
ncbi:MAG: hypothetical protein LBK58_11900 [Prevotellaceae bacterium]|jgi:hypothetical protein|nr:hypothetical protein [Prevotellaceae bacterium]